MDLPPLKEEVERAEEEKKTGERRSGCLLQTLRQFHLLKDGCPFPRRRSWLGIFRGEKKSS